MANDEHLALIRQGTAVWNEWRASNPGIRPDLSDAYLGEADLSGADLRQAYLRKADLRQADISEAELSDAYLHEGRP